MCFRIRFGVIRRLGLFVQVCVVYREGCLLMQHTPGGGIEGGEKGNVLHPSQISWVIPPALGLFY